MCQKCGKDYYSDKSGQKWSGCEFEGCDTWVELRCLKIKILDEKALEFIEYYCNKHVN